MYICTENCAEYVPMVAKAKTHKEQEQHNHHTKQQL